MWCGLHRDVMGMMVIDGRNGGPCRHTGNAGSQRTVSGLHTAVPALARFGIGGMAGRHDCNCLLSECSSVFHSFGCGYVMRHADMARQCAGIAMPRMPSMRFCTRSGFLVMSEALRMCDIIRAYPSGAAAIQLDLKPTMPMRRHSERRAVVNKGNPTVALTGTTTQTDTISLCTGVVVHGGLDGNSPGPFRNHQAAATTNMVRRIQIVSFRERPH
jgi:hypothetical protein